MDSVVQVPDREEDEVEDTLEEDSQEEAEEVVTLLEAGDKAGFPELSLS